MINVPDVLIASTAQQPYRKMGWINDKTATETEIQIALSHIKRCSTVHTIKKNANLNHDEI